MKCLYYITISSLLIFVSCNNLNNKNEDVVKVKSSWNLENLNGEVKSIDEIKYIANTQTIDSIGKFFSRTFYEYNRNGYLILKEEYDYSETLEIKTINEIDCNGYIVKSEKYRGEKEDIINKKVYNYNEDGYIESIESYDKNGEFDFGNYYKLDSDGKVLSTSFLIDKNKKPVSLEEFTYDVNSNRKSCQYTNFDSENESVKLTYECSADGFDLRTKVHSIDGQLLHDYQIEYIFDSNGNWIRRLEIDNGILEFIYIREIEYM